MGKMADRPVPRPVLQAFIRGYVKAYGVNLEEAEKDLTEFNSFGDFFARALKAGQRPVHTNPDVITSPADGVLHNHGTITNGQLLQVKGHGYSVSELLHDDRWAQRFDGGTFATIYLSPKDYHRVHAPSGGRIVESRYIPGALFSVNPICVNNLGNLFTTNERIPIYLETPHGAVCAVLVGATVVGRVSLTFSNLTTNQAGIPERSETFEPPVSINKGDEIGAFMIGSTVVLLMEGAWKPRALTDKMPLRMGTGIFQR